MLCACGDLLERHLGEDGPCMHCRCERFTKMEDPTPVSPEGATVTDAEVKEAKADLLDTLTEFS